VGLTHRLLLTGSVKGVLFEKARVILKKNKRRE
jgi:hypothetical protein